MYGPKSKSTNLNGTAVRKLIFFRQSLFTLKKETDLNPKKLYYNVSSLPTKYLFINKRPKRFS